MFHFGTNHHANGGTASCRSAVFFGLEEEEGRGRRGRELESGRMGEDFERKKEDGEDGDWNWRGGKRDSDKDETRTLRWEENGTQRENENKDSEKEEPGL